MKSFFRHFTDQFNFRALYLVFCTLYLFSSCGKKDPNSPGVEYMPDMYRSPSYETNMSHESGEDTIQNNRLPVAGTISRGFMPYPYANDTGGYANAGRYLRNPIAKSAEVLAEGEVLYSKYCVHCHGATGQGDGLVSAKLPGAPPAYNGPALKNLPEGKIFHSITYGKGLMGPHAPLLNKEERWKLVHFIQKLQNPEGVTAAVVTSTDSTAVAAKTVKEEKK